MKKNSIKIKKFKKKINIFNNKINEHLENKINISLTSKKNKSLIKKLMPQDILFLIKEIGSKNSSIILDILSKKQIQYMIDMDIWHKDKINIYKLNIWIKIFKTLGSKKAFMNFINLDIEIIAIYIKKHANITDIHQYHENFAKGKEIFAYGNKFSINPIHSTSSIRAIEFIKLFISKQYKNNPIFTSNIIHSINFETISSLEESAFFWRNKRIQDLGFYEYEKTKSIKSNINSKEVIKFKCQNNNKSIYFKNKNKKIHLPFSILDINKRRIKKFKIIFNIINKSNIIASDTYFNILNFAKNLHFSYDKDLSNKNSVNKTLTYLIKNIEISILYLIKKINYKTIFSTFTICDLFQISNSIILNLSFKIKKIISKNYLNIKFLLRLHLIDKKIISGLLKAPPLFYEHLISKNMKEFKNFSSSPEIKTTENLIDELLFKINILKFTNLNVYYAEKNDPDYRITFYEIFSIFIINKNFINKCKKISNKNLKKIIIFNKKKIFNFKQKNKIFKQIFIYFNNTKTMKFYNKKKLNNYIKISLNIAEGAIQSKNIKKKVKPFSDLFI